MPQATKSSDIGLRKGALMCRMTAEARLKFIAEGLPIIFESAASLIRASQALDGQDREAAILAGHAEEECAKLLILIDIVRCPPKLIAGCIGPMMRWFYDHLARLIYAEAQHWKPTNAEELQRCIDSERKSHYLEGEYGEYIMPNWTLFRRETALYADVASDERREPTWLSPTRVFAPGIPSTVPPAYWIADALAAFGVLSIEGLRALSDVWSLTTVTKDTGWDVMDQNLDLLLERLDKSGLITPRASEEHSRALVNSWQMPMYGMDFSPVVVPLEDLLAEREAQLPY
jgi:hypothetical protein